MITKIKNAFDLKTLRGRMTLGILIVSIIQLASLAGLVAKLYKSKDVISLICLSAIFLGLIINIILFKIGGKNMTEPLKTINDNETTEQSTDENENK